MKNLWKALVEWWIANGYDLEARRNFMDKTSKEMIQQWRLAQLKKDKDDK